MSFHKHDYSRPIEEEEFDDTELETPARFNGQSVKRNQNTNIIYRSFRANRTNDGITSKKTTEADQIGDLKGFNNNGGASSYNNNDGGYDVLTMRSPPSLKFDTSVSLDNDQHRNQSPTPITRFKPPTTELSPVDHSPVSYKVTKPNTEKKRNKNIECVTETPALKIRNEDEVKQSILDRVNTTLESLKKKNSSEEVSHTPAVSNILPLKTRFSVSNTESIQPIYNFEEEEPDFVHISKQGVPGRDADVLSSDKEPDLSPTVDKIRSKRNIKASPIKDEDTLGNSTPVSKNSRLHESILPNEHDYHGAEISFSSTKWWTAKQWLILMKVVDLKLISRKDAINSQLLMKELGCSSKQELQRRYDFLRQYRTK